MLENLPTRETLRGQYCYGDTPTLADCCLVPQVFNALRFNCRFDPVPAVMQLYKCGMQLPAFQQAAPANQPDAE